MFGDELVAAPVVDGLDFMRFFGSSAERRVMRVTASSSLRRSPVLAGEPNRIAA
jgi:hypothetical protein